MSGIKFGHVPHPNTISDRIFDQSLAHRFATKEIPEQRELLNKVFRQSVFRLKSYKAYVKIKKTILRISQKAGMSPTATGHDINKVLITSDEEFCPSERNRLSKIGIKAPRAKNQVKKAKISSPIASNDLDDEFILPDQELYPSDANRIPRTGIKASKSKKHIPKAKTSSTVASHDINGALIGSDEEFSPSYRNKISKTGIKAPKSKKQVKKAKTSSPIASNDFDEEFITSDQELYPSDANRISQTGMKISKSKKTVKKDEESGFSNANGISTASIEATKPKKQVRKGTKLKQTKTKNFSVNVTPKKHSTRSTRSTVKKQNQENDQPTVRLTRLQLQCTKSPEPLAAEDLDNTSPKTRKIVNMRKITKRAVSLPSTQDLSDEETVHPVISNTSDYFDASPGKSRSYSTNEEFIVSEIHAVDLDEDSNTANTASMTQASSPGATSSTSQNTVLMEDEYFTRETGSPRSQTTDLMEDEDFNDQWEKVQPLKEKLASLEYDPLPWTQNLVEEKTQNDVEDSLVINATKSASPTRNSLEKDLDNQSCDTFISSSTASKQLNPLDQEILDNSTNEEIVNGKNSPMHQINGEESLSQEISPSPEFKSQSCSQNTSDDNTSSDWEDKIEVRSRISASLGIESISYSPAYRSGVCEDEKIDFTVQVNFDDNKMSSYSPKKHFETEELEDSICVPLEQNDIKDDEQKPEVRSRRTRSASLEKNIQSTLDSPDECSVAEVPHSTTGNPQHSPKRNKKVSGKVSDPPGQYDDEFLLENEAVTTQDGEINISQDRSVSLEHNSLPNSQKSSDNEAQDDVGDKIYAGSEKSASPRHASPALIQPADEAGNSDNEDVKSDGSASPLASNHSLHNELDVNDEVKSDVDKMSTCSRSNSPAHSSLNYDLDTQEEMEDYTVTYRRQTPLPMLESAAQDEISQIEVAKAKSPSGKTGSTPLGDSGIDETSQDMSEKEYFENKSKETSGAVCGEKRPPKITSTEILTSKYTIIGKKDIHIDGMKSPGRTNKTPPENNVTEDHVYSLDNNLENILGINDQILLDEQEKVLAMRSPEEKRPKKTVKNVTPRPVQLRDLVEKDNLYKINCMRSTLAIDDMTPDDEILVMEFPKLILDNQDFVGKKMRLKLRTLRIGDTTYEIQRQNNSGPIPCILNKQHGTSKYRKGSIQPSARIVIRRALEDQNDSIVSTEGLSESKTRSLPTNLKQRNQFINMSSTYSSDIVDQETHEPKRDSTPEIQVPRKKKSKTHSSESDSILIDCNTATDEISKQERDSTPEIHVTKKKKKSKRPTTESDNELNDNTPTNDEISKQECDFTPEIHVTKKKKKSKRPATESDNELNDNTPTYDENDCTSEIQVPKKEEKVKRRTSESDDLLNDCNRPTIEIEMQECDFTPEIHVTKKKKKSKRPATESDNELNDNTPTNDDNDCTSEIQVPKKEEKVKRRTSESDDLLNDCNRPTIEIEKQEDNFTPEIQISKKEKKPKRRISESDDVLNDFNKPLNEEIEKQEPVLAHNIHVTKRKNKFKRRTFESDSLSSDFNKPKIEEIPKKEDDSTSEIHVKKKRKKSKRLTSESDVLLSDFNKPTNDEIPKEEDDSTLQTILPLYDTKKKKKKEKRRTSKSDGLLPNCTSTTNEEMRKRKRDSASEQTPEKKFKNDPSESDVKKKKKIFFSE